MKIYELLWDFIFNSLMGFTGYTWQSPLTFAFGRDNWIPTASGVFEPALFGALIAHLGSIVLLVLIVLLFIRLTLWVFRLVSGAFRW